MLNKNILSILEYIEYCKRHFVNPEKYIPKIFKKRVGYELNLKHPETFNEKMQWMKLYYKNPTYATFVDKYAVKAYVAQTIGKEYVIPTLGVWNSFDSINFSQLPEQFVLKCTHDSGGLVICKDRKTLNWNEARKKISKSLGFNYYYMGFEWPYKNVKPRIIAEKYLEDNETKELRDYKFFVFNGEVRALFIASNRNKKDKEVNVDFFSADFEHLPFERGHKNAIQVPEKPLLFDEMKILAQKLSKDIPFVRIDFYEVNEKIYFGEMTFFPGCGWEPFVPETWDYTFGKWLNLPNPTHE